MTSGAVVLSVAVGLALVVAMWRSVSDGRFGRAGADAPEPSAAADVVRRSGRELGEQATLLQFSSAFCAPCRATRRVLADVADQLEGVTHVELDADEHLEVTRSLGILRTPTTLVLDARGREVARAAGAPTRPQVLVAVGQAIP